MFGHSLRLAVAAVLAVAGLLLSGGAVRAQISSLCTTDNSTPPITTCQLQNNANTGPTLGRFDISVPADAQELVGNGIFGAPVFGAIVYVDALGRIVAIPTVVNGVVDLTDADAGMVVNGDTRNSNWSTFSSDGRAVVTVFSNGRFKTEQAFSFDLDAAPPPPQTFSPTSVWVGSTFINPVGPPDESVVFTYRLGGDTFSGPAEQDRLSKSGYVLSGVGLVAGFLPGGDGPIGVLASLDSFLFGAAAFVDPPDLNFTTVVTPAPPSIDVSTLGPAAQQLAQTEEQVIGLLNAIITTTNRATGAALSGDSASQQLQVGALPGFEAQLDAELALLPAQLAAFGQEAKTAGFDPSTVTLAQVIAEQQSLSTNGLPANQATTLTALGIDAATQGQIARILATSDPVRALSIIKNLFATGPVAPPNVSAAANLQQFAAVLPESRSVTVGTPATAFATIINAGTTTASQCTIAPDSFLPINFTFQTTDPRTNAVTGSPNVPVDIPAGANRSFVIAITPTTSLIPVNVDFDFYCANANSAPSIVGVDTLLLSGSTTPVPDVVALAASGDPGIVDIPGNSGTGDFAVATVNVGAQGTITAAADTGGATLPLTATICETNPQTGACISNIGANVTTVIGANQTPTFAIFVTGSNNVPFDPANNRVFVRFTDASGVVRGATSVAVRTQ